MTNVFLLPLLVVVVCKDDETRDATDELRWLRGGLDVRMVEIDALELARTFLAAEAESFVALAGNMGFLKPGVEGVICVDGSAIDGDGSVPGVYCCILGVLSGLILDTCRGAVQTLDPA